MRLFDRDGHGVDLRVTGYQFPDAEDARKRYSWHMVEGVAVSATGMWEFRYPALTCDESTQISMWLCAAADRASCDDTADRPTPLTFTEPNLTFGLVSRRGDIVTLEIGFDLEFSPPWRRRTRAGDAFVLVCEPTRDQVRRAAEEWDQEIAAYPHASS